MQIGQWAISSEMYGVEKNNACYAKKKLLAIFFAYLFLFWSNWICPQFVHKGKGNLRPGLGVVYAPPNFSSAANGWGKRVKFDDARTHRSKVPVVILASLVIALLGQQFWSWKEKTQSLVVSVPSLSLCVWPWVLLHQLWMKDKFWGKENAFFGSNWASLKSV